MTDRPVIIHARAPKRRPTAGRRAIPVIVGAPASEPAESGHTRAEAAERLWRELVRQAKARG